jgi:hypothetical protein
VETASAKTTFDMGLCSTHESVINQSVLINLKADEFREAVW